MILRFAVIDDYTTLWTVDHAHRRILSAYLQHPTCELRTDTTTTALNAVSTFRRVSGAVTVLDVHNSLYKDAFETLEIKFHIQRIIRESSHSLRTLVVHRHHGRLRDIYPFLIKCTKIRACHELCVEITQIASYIGQFQTFFECCGNTLTSLSFSPGFDSRFVCTFDEFAKLIVTHVPHLASLKFPTHTRQDVQRTLSRLSALTNLVSLVVDFSVPWWDSTDKDANNITEKSYREYGAQLQTFPALSALEFTSNREDLSRGVTRVTWALAPTIVHFRSNCVDVISGSRHHQQREEELRQERREEEWRQERLCSLQCNMYNNASSFLDATMPNLTTLTVTYVSHETDPLIGVDAVLAAFRAPTLVHFEAKRLPLEYAPLVLHMPALRFLVMNLTYAPSCRDMLHFLESMPFIETIDISCINDRKKPKAAAAAAAASTVVGINGATTSRGVCVSHLRTLCIGTFCAAPLFRMLLTLEAPRLSFLRMEMLNDKATQTVLLHFPWLAYVRTEACNFRKFLCFQQDHAMMSFKHVAEYWD